MTVNGVPKAGDAVWKKPDGRYYMFFLPERNFSGINEVPWLFESGSFAKYGNGSIMRPANRFSHVLGFMIADKELTQGVEIDSGKLDNPTKPHVQYARGVLNFNAPNGDKIRITGLD